jgi:hypothetical protein
MNKQEALQEILAECRKYENVNGTDSPDGAHRAAEALSEATEALHDEDLPLRPARVNAAVRAAGALLYLIVDEQG